VNDADFDLRAVKDAASVTRLAQQLYGPGFEPREGVLHVTAVAGLARRTLRIDEHTPKSLADTVALNLARARADAIVITGKLLRDEPALSYAPGSPGPAAPAMADYRQQLGTGRAPLAGGAHARRGLAVHASRLPRRPHTTVDLCAPRGRRGAASHRSVRGHGQR
jgi:hypothetical protein